MPTILIVEDEAKMRRLLELNLGEDGFTTLSAGDAEAVDIGASDGQFAFGKTWRSVGIWPAGLLGHA